MRTTARRLVLTLLTVTVAALGLAAAAQAFPNGDVFVSVSNGHVNEYHPDGTFVQQLDTTKAGVFTTGMAFDATGTLYVTDVNAQAVSKFDPTGALLGDFGGGYNSDPESILFDAAGNADVGQPDGSHQILKFDAAGNPLAAYSPSIEGRGTDWIDLAADQCTMLYAGEGSTIGSFDVCTNTQNPDFATGLTGSNAYALRILPDGSVLVADSSQIVHLDAGGNPIATYVVPGEANWFAFNLDPDGTSFWSADFGTADVYHFDSATASCSATSTPAQAATRCSAWQCAVSGRPRGRSSISSRRRRRTTPARRTPSPRR